MSAFAIPTQRLLGPLAAVGLLLVALVLRVAGSTRGQIAAAAADPQGFVTAAGADQFVLAFATVLGWILLGWISLAAVLVLGSAVPGWCGWTFGQLARVLLPATLRRFVSLALGVAMLTGTSVASAAPPATMAAISITLDWPAAAASSQGAVPDWPGFPGPIPGPSADEPSAFPAGPDRSDGPEAPSSYVVQRGDCLWDIAERYLARAGQPVDAASVAAAVRAWWQANAAQIANPELIFPGQVLVAPAP